MPDLDQLNESCRVCGVMTGLGCPKHPGPLCANCDCPDCRANHPSWNDYYSRASDEQLEHDELLPDEPADQEVF